MILLLLVIAFKDVREWKSWTCIYPHGLAVNSSAGNSWRLSGIRQKTQEITRAYTLGMETNPMRNTCQECGALGGEPCLGPKGVVRSQPHRLRFSRCAESMRGCVLRPATQAQPSRRKRSVTA